MRFTIRQKLFAVLAITAAGFGLILITGAAITGSVRRQLDELQERYVPLVELRPELESEFDRLSFAFQDAVVANDQTALEEAAAIKDSLLRRIEASRANLDPQTATELQGAIEEYYSSAAGLAERLIHGDTGIDAVEAMMRLQSKHARVLKVLDQTTIFNRETLTQAFGLINTALDEADRQRFAMGLAGVVAVVLLAFWIMHDLIRSISSLSQGFARFGRGEFATPIRAEQSDELGALASSANQMAAQIRELLAESRRKSEALEAANKELESFSYSVSHDLRAPLRAIDGFSRALVLDYGEQLDEKARHYLERVRAATQRMSALIDDILNLSRISRAPVKEAEVDLTSMVTAILAELLAREPDRRVEMVVEPAMTVRADPRLLTLAMENLLRNAWKFTGKQAAARIEVGRFDRAGETVFFVRDNGAGFNMAQAGRLFGAFQRLHTEAEFEGTGVGLANVQRVIHRHGGRIWAEGEPGKGATFYFTLGGSQ